MYQVVRPTRAARMHCNTAPLDQSRFSGFYITQSKRPPEYASDERPMPHRNTARRATNRDRFSPFTRSPTGSTQIRLLRYPSDHRYLVKFLECSNLARFSHHSRHRGCGCLHGNDQSEPLCQAHLPSLPFHREVSSYLTPRLQRRFCV